MHSLNTSLEFLAQLNDAEKDWGFWIDRDRVESYHIGQYSFENDRLPKSFVHIGSLDNLAHQRQQYILSHLTPEQDESSLGREWAKTFLNGLAVAA